MKWSIAFVVAALLLAPSCRAEDGDEDRLVIAAVVAHLCDSKEPGFTVLSSTSSMVDAAFASNPELDKAAVESLVRRNTAPALLPLATSCSKIKVTRQADIEAAMKEPSTGANHRSPYWTSFYRAFPGSNGTLHISFPGYSKDRRSALVQVSASCDSLCGSGFFWVMRKSTKGWELKKTVSGWVE